MEIREVRNRREVPKEEEEVAVDSEELFDGLESLDEDE